MTVYVCVCVLEIPRVNSNYDRYHRQAGKFSIESDEAVDDHAEEIEVSKIFAILLRVRGIL